MRRELWRQAEELFHAALEQSPEERRAFLDSACGQDTELRRHVELLVSAEEDAGSFLDKAGVADLTATIRAAGSLVGRQFGHYRIVSPLGAGGMGEVYRAHDTKLSRDVVAEIDGRKSRVVELRYFGGLSLEETAEILAVSAETAKRDWKMARAWLYTQLAGQQKPIKT